ncbi:MAG: mechanosensitive ion channel [Myxococcales bacterium]|nr:mechanosensitive ion channel [Myxococcales bacterium]
MSWLGFSASGEELAALPGQLVGLAGLALVAGILYFVAQRVLLRLIRAGVQRTATQLDDALVEAKVFVRLAHLAPALAFYLGIGLLPELPETIRLIVERVAISVMVIVVVLGLSGFLNAVNTVYSRNPENRHRPIKSYVQVAKLVLALIAGLLILATLMDRSPLLFLSGLGAVAAVLMLVFRDTILSLVASVQLTSQDMIHVGDWIEMPSFGADGDVIDVALHTIKVQNWDKTITTIPTYALISNSFKNWRGMSQAGARRIKRALSVDVQSVRFLTDAEVEVFSTHALLGDYIAEKKAELERYNEAAVTSKKESRRLTNVGTFRAYVVAYLRSHAAIHQGMTLLVRQLAPTAEGLPIELYCFTRSTDWGVYEDVQSDIFDHLLAIAPQFGLRIFQAPSGFDLAALAAGGAERDAG